MKLEKLSISNFGGFKEIDIDFETDVTLIAGVNGVGKSTIMQAISILISKAHRRTGLSGSNPLKVSFDHIFLGQEKANLKLSASNNKNKFLMSLNADTNRRKFEKFSLVGALENLKHHQLLCVLYTPKRQLPGNPRSLPNSNQLSPSLSFHNALQDREVELREFMHWFRIQQNQEHEFGLRIIGSLKKAVSELIPEFSDLKVIETPRLAFQVTKNHKPFFLQQLSDGERGLMALVLDLTRRLAIANPDMQDPISNGEAVVLIDEIELHLHPKWQRDVMERLPKIFKNCQFVITTHSPQVIGEVEACCVRLLSLDANEKITVETPGVAFGADSNWILSVLMGAEERNEEVENELSKIAELISQKCLNDAKEKIASLKERNIHTAGLQRFSSLIERMERLGR